MDVRKRRGAFVTAIAALTAAAGIAKAQALNGTVTLSSITGTVTGSTTAPNGYGVDDINSCSIDINNIISADGFQYIAYYGPLSTGGNPVSTIYLGRRADPTTANPSPSWSILKTSLTMPTGNSSSAGDALSDDHNVIALGVDSSGDMHLAFGMHNTPLNGSSDVGYYISTGSATGSSWTSSALGLTKKTSLVSGGANESEVTYPEFYNLPGSTDLLFSYRQGGAGGGSGNGDQYFDDYNPSTQTFSQTRVIDGMDDNVNAYLNSMVYTSTGNLLMTWTWRATPNWQTNSNIMFAQSPDNGVTWYQQGGTTQYTLPITPAGTGSAAQQAQVVVNIPENDSFINQTSMTVDGNDNPMVASYDTPGWNVNTNSGNPNRQYMLFYYDGSEWRQSQVSDRTSDTSIDTGGGDVRDLGRPIVLVDASGRVLVVTRSENIGMGDYDANLGANQNNIVVYYNTVASLDSASPLPWQSVALDSANMGEYEPTYDSTLWKNTGILDLFYEPSDVNGNETSDPVQVLQWNEAAYFASVTPATVIWDANIGTSGVQDGGGTWNTTNLNFSDDTSNYAWINGTTTSATFGAGNGAAGTVTLGAAITATNLTFDATSSGSYNIAGGGFTLTLASGSVITTNVNATISAPISAAGFTKEGVGTLTLSGSNTFTGSLVLGTGAVTGGNLNGTLQITSAAAVSGVTTISFPDNNGAYSVFQLNGSGGSITLPSTLNFSIDGTTGTNLTANMIESVAGNNTINSTFTLNSGGSQYAVQSDAGTLTVNSNYNLGTLSSRDLDLQGAGNGIWAGVLGNGTGGGLLTVNKYGAGTWALSNTNTASGPLLVSAGRLNLTGSIASTSVTVSPSAILNASGSPNDGLSTSAALAVTGAATLAAGPSGGGITPRTLASITLGSGGLVQLAAPATHVDRQVLVTGSLALGGSSGSWQGQFDLSANDLIVHNGNLATITNQLAQGYDGGAWNGSGGIISSAAAGDTSLGVVLNSNGSGALTSTFDGQTVTSTDVLVKFTYIGDADLNGVVNGSDYTLIDNGLNNGLAGWRNGDFNYDGVVNGDDYTLIDNAFNTQGPSLAVVSTEMIAHATAQIADGSSASTAVPEPASLILFGFAAVVLSRRRR